MSKSKIQDKKQQAESKALRRTTTLFIVFGGVIFAVFWWARNDDKSEVAAQIRELLGIQLVLKQAPEPASAPPAPVYEPEPAPEPEPIVFEEPAEPEPQALDWADFVADQSIWPRQLEIVIDPVITLRYRGKSFGEMGFEAGQILTVINFSKDGLAFGRTNGNEIEIHVSATNFSGWFEKTHGESYEITLPERVTRREVKDFEDELITNLRIWCLKNYSTPLIEINENSLVMRLHAEGNSDYALEAQSVARAYLRIQAGLGGNDNYASCEIRDSKTGRVVGSKGIFIPRL